MAVIKCRGCGNDVSDLIDQCANCGFVINRMNPYLMMALWLILIMGLIFVINYAIA